MKIYPVSEPVGEYQKAINLAHNRDSLLTLLEPWKRIAADAIEIAQAMTHDDFKVFRRGLRQERRGTFAGEEWAERFSAVTMPTVMFKISMIANQFKVPWGVAFIRCKDVGRIVEHSGIAKWVDPPK